MSNPVTRNVESIHYEGEHDTASSPYVPAIRVTGGQLIFISGVTAAPVYHDHPHAPAVFDAVPADMAGQVGLIFEHLGAALDAAGCSPQDVVSLSRFFTHVREDQDVVNAHQAKWFGGHVPTSTSVEVTELATDPRLRLEISAVAVTPS